MRYGTGERIRRRIDEEQKVLEAVQQWRAEGKPMNEEAFVEIAKSTAVGSTSKLKELLKEGRMWQKR